MKWISWWLRRATAILGFPGIAGLALLLIAVVMYGTMVNSHRAQLESLKQETASLKQRIAQAAKSGIPEAGSAEELNKFYSFFSNGTHTEWLDKLYSTAETEQVALAQGEYRGLTDPSGKLTRYQVTLPVKGSYVQIRRFIDAALIAVPVASLDDVSFKREAIAAEQLEARIKFTLFLGAQP